MFAIILIEPQECDKFPLFHFCASFNAFNLEDDLTYEA